jgi:hypothetical protein
MTQPTAVKAEARIVTRLNQAAFAAFRSKLPPPSLPKTDLEAGYLLGIQRALEVLREGFVVEVE